MKWGRVPLREVLTPVSRPEPVDTSRTYSLLGAHWYAKGLYTKETKSGSEIKATVLYRVEEGDFVYNRLFAWMGSFAVASQDNSGCYVSNEFPCFRVDPERLDARFLWYYFSREPTWAEALGLSSGSTPTSRNRLNEARLLAMEIPLPPIEYQARTAERIGSLSGQLWQVQGLRQEVKQEIDTLCVAMAHRTDLNSDAKTSRGWRKTRLSKVLHLIEEVVEVDPESSYPNLGIYSFGRGLFRKAPISGATTSAKSLRRVRSGQFIYSRLFAFEGAYGVVTSEFDGSFVSNEYPTFNCDYKEIRCDFLHAYFRYPRVWEIIAEGSRGLGNRRQRVQPEGVLAHELWLPPIAYQDELAAIQAQLGQVEKLHTETAGEVEALVPALIDRAVRGEL